jgi:hypothetical protein
MRVAPAADIETSMTPVRVSLGGYIAEGIERLTLIGTLMSFFA